MKFRKLSKNASFWLMVSPALFVFLTVVIVPFIIGMYYSFTDWSAVPGKTTKFIGFANYIKVFNDTQFLNAFWVTLQYAFYAIILINVVGFSLSLLVSRHMRSANMLRAMFFMPNLVGGLILGYVWKFIFSKILPEIIVGSPSLLSTTSGALFAMAIVSTWQMGGYIMIIYLAAIKAIPEEMFEAAQIDGANTIQRIRYILFPLVAPAFTISLFLTLSGSFKMFDVNVSLTGGDPMRSTELLSMEIINKAFKEVAFAEGQAQAVIFFLFVAVITIIQVYLTSKREVEM